MSSEFSNDSSEFLKKSNLVERVKSYLFTTLNRVLQDKRVSVRTGYFLLFLQFMELVSLIMSKKNTILVQIIGDSSSSYLNYLRLYPFLLEEENDLLYFLLVSLIAVILGSVVYFSYRIYSFDEYEHRKHEKMKQIFALALDVIDTALVLPFSGVILSGFNCSNSDPAVPECFGAMYIIRSGIAVVLAVVLGAVILTTALFFFNFGMTSKDALTRSPHIFHFIVRIYTVVVVFLDFFMSSDQFMIITGIHTVGTLAFCLDYYLRLPYYNQDISQFYCFAAFTYFWISIGFFTSYVVGSDLITDNILYIILVGFLFFIYIVRTFRNRFFSELLLKETSEIQNEIHLDARFRYLARLYKQSRKDKESEMLLFAAIKRHSDTCNNDLCVCSKRKKLYDPKTGQFGDESKPLYKDEVFIKSFFLQIIQESLNTFPQSIVLNLDYFLYLMNELRNLPLLNNQINAFMKNKESSTQTTMQYCIYRIRLQQKGLLKSMNADQKISKIRYEQVRSFDEGLSLLEARVSAIVEACLVMWDSLTNHIPDLDILKQYCTKIVDQKQVIYSLYKGVLSHNSHSYELFLLMRLYSELVIFDDLLSMEVQESIELVEESKLENSIDCDINDVLNKMDMFGNSSCVIFMSMVHENLGNITWASTNCYSIFGYDAKELKRMNVDSLMPGEIARFHQTFIRLFFEIGRQSNMNKMSHLWGVHKSRLLFSMNLYLKLFMLDNEIFVVGLITRLNDSDYILTNSIGNIEGFGLLFEQLLGVNHAEWAEQQYKMNFLLLAPKLMKYFRSNFFGTKNKDVYNKEEMEQEAIEELKAGRHNRFFKLFIPGNMHAFLREFTDEYNTILTNLRGNEGPENLRLRMEIAHMLYRWTIRVENMQYSRILKIKAHVSFKDFGRSKLKVFQIKILSFVTFSKHKFTREKKRAEFIERETLKATNAALGTLERMSKKKPSEIADNQRASMLMRLPKNKEKSGLFSLIRLKSKDKSGNEDQEEGTGLVQGKNSKPGEALRGVMKRKSRHFGHSESGKFANQESLKEMLLKKSNNVQPPTTKPKETESKGGFLKGFLKMRTGKAQSQEEGDWTRPKVGEKTKKENNQKPKGGLLGKLKGLGNGQALKSPSAKDASNEGGNSSGLAPPNLNVNGIPGTVQKPSTASSLSKIGGGKFNLSALKAGLPSGSNQPQSLSPNAPSAPVIIEPSKPKEIPARTKLSVNGFKRLMSAGQSDQEKDIENSPVHLSPQYNKGGLENSLYKMTHNLITPENNRRKNLLAIESKKGPAAPLIKRQLSSSSQSSKKGRGTFDYSIFNNDPKKQADEDEVLIHKSEDEESQDDEEADLVEDEPSNSVAGIEIDRSVRGKNKFQQTVHRFFNVRALAGLYLNRKKNQDQANEKERIKEMESEKAPTIRTRKDKQKFVEKGISNSVTSSVNSVVSYKADLKKIRDLLQNQSSPAILRFAIGIIVLFSVLTLLSGIVIFLFCDELVKDLDRYLDSLANIAMIMNSMANINLLRAWGNTKILANGLKKEDIIDFEALTKDIVHIGYDASVDELLTWSEVQMNEVLMEADFTIIRNFFYNKEAFWTLNVDNEYALEEMLLISYIRTYIANAQEFNGENAQYFYLNLTPFINYLLEFFDNVTQIVKDWTHLLWVLILVDVGMKPFLFCLGLMITFPVVVQTMLKVEDVLELFTKIGQKEINVYAMHFKSLSTELKNFESFEILYDQVRSRYIEQIRTKSQLKVIGTSSTLIRRLKVNKWSILWKYALVGLALSTVFILNDIIFVYICRIYENTEILYGDSVLSESNIKNIYAQLLQGFNLAYSNLDYSLTLESLQNSQESLKASSIDLFQDIFKNRYSSQLENFLNSMNSEDNCELFFDLLDPNPCETELGEFLEHSLPVSFRFSIDYVEYAIENHFNGNSTKDLSLKEFLEEEEILMRLNLISYLNTTLNEQSDEIYSYISSTTQRYYASAIALLCFMILVLLIFILVVLLNISKALFNNLKYSYSFLLLIPFHVIKENAYIKLFLKRTMRFKGKFD